MARSKSSCSSSKSLAFCAALVPLMGVLVFERGDCGIDGWCVCRWMCVPLRPRVVFLTGVELLWMGVSGITEVVGLSSLAFGGGSSLSSLSSKNV